MPITPSSTGPGEATTKPDVALPENQAEILRKRVSIGFAATVAIGLMVSGLHIGGRLFAGPHTPRQPVVSAVAPVVNMPVPRVVILPPVPGAPAKKALPVQHAVEPHWIS